MALAVKRYLQRTGFKFATGSAWPILLIFALGFGLLTTTSMVEKSATFDEPNKLVSGYANLRWRDYRLVPDHPPLVRMINALPLLALKIPDLRSEGRRWHDSLTSATAQRLFTQATLHRGDADRILLWGRIPVVGLAVLLGCFVFLWAKQLYGTTPAIVVIYPHYLAYFNELIGGT